MWKLLYDKERYDEEQLGIFESKTKVAHTAKLMYLLM